MEMSVDYDDGVVETFPIAGQSVHINYGIISYKYNKKLISK